MTAAAERIDSETGEVLETRPTALARIIPGGSRVLALDAMDEADFEARLTVLRTGQTRMRRIQKELLGDGDFGTIPGTKKPTLLKPGAEKLLRFYGLVATFTTTRTLGDGVTAPSLHVLSVCRVHVGDADGPIIAEGEGTCNTWERKYRYRRDGTESSDPLDVDNTIVKMARKRALVDGTLLATATSGLFTQDLEDQEPDPTTLAPAVRAARMLEALAACDSVKAFDALAAEMAPAVLQLPDDVRTDFRAKVVTLRKPLFDVAKAEWEARQAANREPDPEPAAAPIPPQEVPAADDEPPSDEEQAKALVMPCTKATTAKALAALWTTQKTSPAYAAATPEARVIAQQYIDDLAAAAKGGK